MEFRTFRPAFIDIPCQIVRTARTVRWRVHAWNPSLGIFFRLIDALSDAAPLPHPAPGLHQLCVNRDALVLGLVLVGGETSEAAWFVLAAEPDDPFDSKPALWSRVLARQPGRLAWFANFPPAPSLN